MGLRHCCCLHLTPCRSHLQASLEAVSTAQQELEAGRRALARQRDEVTTAQEQVAQQQAALERQSRGLATREGQAKDRAQEAEQQKVGEEMHLGLHRSVTTCHVGMAWQRQ